MPDIAVAILLMVAGALALAWHYRGYFNGRYDTDHHEN